MMNGYTYCINRKSPGRTFWLCSSYAKTKCSARIVTIGKNFAKSSQEHNHSGPENIKVTDKTQYAVVKLIHKSK